MMFAECNSKIMMIDTRRNDILHSFNIKHLIYIEYIQRLQRFSYLMQQYKRNSAMKPTVHMSCHAIKRTKLVSVLLIKKASK